MPDRIPLARPAISGREEELVLEALRSGRLSLGPMLQRFERAFAGLLGVEDAVAVSSGTAGLHLCVRGAGWGPGEEVLTSPLSFVASANAILYEGATPVFCDVDPETLDIDPEAARAVAGERTAGMLAVHIFGYPAAIGELERLCARFGGTLVEDACEAVAAVDSEGRSIGTRGNPAVFGFYANKQLTTGEGGIVVPTDPADAARLRSERNQGRAPDMGWLAHDRLGFNYRLTELQAAVGVAQLERAEELIGRRSRLAATYGELLGERLGAAPAGEGDPDGLQLPCRDREPERRGWFLYPVRLPAQADRAAVIDALASEGIESKAYFPCIHLMPHYRERFGYREGDLPVAEQAARRSLALPFHPAMGEAEVEEVVGGLGRALGRG